VKAIVYLSKAAQKDIARLPRHILVHFDLWVEIIETEGLSALQRVRGYRDHSLSGPRKGQRSSSLSRSWRVIYRVKKEDASLSVQVLEVNHHEY
jgi:addiction module RelE/StbE family toxin